MYPPHRIGQTGIEGAIRFMVLKCLSVRCMLYISLVLRHVPAKQTCVRWLFLSAAVGKCVCACSFLLISPTAQGTCSPASAPHKMPIYYCIVKQEPLEHNPDKVIAPCMKVASKHQVSHPCHCSASRSIEQAKSSGPAEPEILRGWEERGV